mgnify:CR=1 FL=1
MEPIITTGTKIFDTDLLKSTGIARITLELTEQDSLQFYGSFSVAEGHKVLANVRFDFTEVEGNNNGFKLPEKTGEPIKKEETIYQKFKRTCEDYSGLDYYNRLKKHLGVEHLKELEAKHSVSMVIDILTLQEELIFGRQYNREYQLGDNIGDLPLVHKHNAYNLWLELFESFNNSK